MSSLTQPFLTQPMTIFRRCIILLSLILIISLISSVAYAQRVSLIRDAEIEGLLKTYTSKIFKAAGLGRGAVDVYIINSPTYNAFVSDRRMFINSGALMQSDTPNQIIGVIAHETGHIIGGHQQRLRDRFERAQILAGIGLLMGAGAMASGGDLGDSAGMAIIQGGGEVLRRSFLSYKRDEESSADRAGLKLLTKTGQSGKGMLETFERLGGRLLFSSSRPDPYIQSHPLPRDRIALLKTKVNSSPHFAKPDSVALQLRHDMMRAKIAAYSGGMASVRRVFKKDLHGAPALYGSAISSFLRGRTDDGLKIINKLIKQQPKNAYLYEMKAEMLLRGRRAKEGIKPMQKAIKLDPYKSGLLRIQYGHLLLETNEKKHLSESIKQIKRGLARDPKTISGYSDNSLPQLKALRFCSIATPFNSIAFSKELISIGIRLF